jgi:hypothetical protein
MSNSSKFFVAGSEKFSQSGSSQTLTRLQPGMHVLWEGQECLVEMVNDGSARVRPIAKRERVIVPATGAEAGKRIVIYSKAPAAYISPNSEIPIL